MIEPYFGISFHEVEIKTIVVGAQHPNLWRLLP